MFKNYLKGIEGIADYPLISLVAFFLFFTVVLVWWMRMDRQTLNSLSELPFSDDKNSESEIKSTEV